ncbi:nuclear transport factor 2 family protein [Tatumella sp. UBA2305]|uniref:nuclear transport factor 2 family protein n=1 Tax=Tatumella sp. UBA2305 TaxID=1947647 RepID=UPI0025F87E99|nr:nuclear transport factor 2 family protein [Tatumella sp. UBA2305]
MSKIDNISLVRRLYESGAAPEIIEELFSSDIVWDIAPGFPKGGIYYGHDSTMKDFFEQFMPLFASWSTEPQEYFGDEDNHVFVFGEYHGVGKDGRKADVRFSHLWTVKDGQLIALKQCADSYPAQQLLTN